MRKVATLLVALALVALALILIAPPAVRATGPTVLTVAQLKVNNYAVQAGDLALSFTACDNTNGNYYVAAGTEILEVQNTDSSAHTFTVSSVADNYGRLDTSLTGYSVPVSPGIVVIQIKQMQGWLGSGNVISLLCNSNMLKFAVVRYAQ